MGKRGIAFVKKLCAVLFMASAAATFAQTPGTDYREVSIGPAAPAGTLEVTELFAYWCAHCAALRPELEAWRARLPRGTVYRRIPIAFSPQQAAYTQMYYTLESLGRADELHARVYEAIHVAKRPLGQPEQQAEFMAQFGIEPKKYLDASRSFAVQSKARTAQGYRVDSVPALVINGRYMTTPSMAQGTQFLRVADQLVGKATGKPVAPGNQTAGAAQASKPAPPAAASTASTTQPASAPAAPGGGARKGGLPPPQYPRRALTIAACQSFIDRKLEHERRNYSSGQDWDKYRAAVQDSEKTMFESQLKALHGRYVENAIALQLRGRHVTLEWLNNRIDGKQYTEYEKRSERDAVREILDQKLYACHRDALLANVGYSEGPRADYPTPRIRIMEAGRGRSR